MMPWEEVADLIAKCRTAFTELESLYASMGDMNRQYFDTLGVIKVSSGGMADRCVRLQQEVERLANERDNIADELRGRRVKIENEIRSIYESKLQDVTRQIDQEAFERRKVLGQITSEIDTAKAQLQTLVQFVDTAEAKKVATMAAIDADMNKSKKRLAEAQKLADQAMKDYDQKMQYIDSRGAQREAEQRARITVLDGEIKKAEERLAAAKQAARVALAAMVEE